MSIRLDGPEPVFVPEVVVSSGRSSSVVAEFERRAAARFAGPASIDELRALLAEVVDDDRRALTALDARQRRVAVGLLRSAVTALHAGDFGRVPPILDVLVVRAVEPTDVGRAAFDAFMLELVDAVLAPGREQVLGLGAGVAPPAGHWVGGRAAVDVLALGAKGRACRSLSSLLARHGGQAVQVGALLAVWQCVEVLSMRVGVSFEDAIARVVA